MYRKGKYTKKTNAIASSRRFLGRRWQAWKKLSRRKKILFVSAPIVAFMVITPLATYAYYYNDIGNREVLLNRNNTGVVLMDKNSKVFFSTGRAEHRDIVPLDKISEQTKQALIASEDKDFYKHGGFSPLSIVRALYSNIVARGIAGGGSTITQQLAKNTLLTKQQTILRKYQELTLSLAIEQRYSKEDILTMYLNSVYYGENSFGIEEAAQNYFSKTPDQLSLAESAMLIGVLPAPSAYSPITGDPELAKERQTTVLSRMVKNGYISEDDKAAALSQELAYADPALQSNNPAPHFTEMVLNELYKKYGEEKVTRSGFQVVTTLDTDLQNAANDSVDKGIAYIEANGGSNASLIAVDPKSGGIRALVGSADYTNEDFGKVNMATTKRQPGSSFKPIYYADALARGKITPTTVIKDESTDFGNYTPQNASKSFYGNVTVRQALSWSLNIPAVKVMQKEGLSSGVEAAKKLGITTLDESSDYGLSLALGSAEVPLDEMTNAYAAFANQGERYETRTVQSIKDKYNRALFTNSNVSKRAISAEGAYLISSILSDNQTRSRIFGGSLNVNGTDGMTKSVAVKTGTTDDSKDAWTIGYTSEIAVGVWTGNNDNTPMQSGGSDMAGPIWRAMMKQAIGRSSPSFTQPAGVVKASVCTEVGTKSDVFLSTNVPKQCSSAPKDEDKKDEPEKKPVEQPKCAITGKESLEASDPKCKAEMCEVEGKEALAANDPNCKEPIDEEESTKDGDSDGVVDTIDKCPGTLPGIKVDGTGCPVKNTPTPPGQKPN